MLVRLDFIILVFVLILWLYFAFFRDFFFLFLFSKKFFFFSTRKKNWTIYFAKKYMAPSDPRFSEEYNYKRFLLLDFYFFCSSSKRFNILYKYLSFDDFVYLFDSLSLCGSDKIIHFYYVALSSFVFKDSLFFILKCRDYGFFHFRGSETIRRDISLILCEYFNLHRPKNFSLFDETVDLFGKTRENF